MLKIRTGHIQGRHILILSLVVVVIGGTIISLKLERNSPPTPSPAPKPMPAINVPPNAAPLTNFQISSQLDAPLIPKEEYTLTNQLPHPTEQASLFGFTAPPAKDTLTNSHIRYSWKENEKSLIIDEEDGLTSLFYSNGDGTKYQPPTLDANMADKIVKDFAQAKLGLPSNISLSPLHFEYSLVQGNSGKVTKFSQEANTSSLSYTYVLGSIPLYTSTSTPYSLRATVSGDGTIIQFFAYILPQLKPVTNSSSIAIDQAIQAVREGKAILYEAYPSEMVEGLPNPDFTTVVVESIVPCYLYDISNNLFRSMYKIEGSAGDNNISQLKYRVIYLTPAKL